MNASSPRLARNNFHLIRLLCAIVVCMYHASELSKFPALAWVPKVLSPNIALNSFFIISGFLISLSHERSKSTAQFFKKRFFRIYPAYAFVVLSTAVFCFAISTEGFLGYFGVNWWKHLTANLLLLNFLNPTLPGVFAENRFPDINGSLWTIKVEVFLYTTIPLLSFVSKRVFGAATQSIAYLGVVCAWAGLDSLFNATNNILFYHLSREIASPLAYFLAGAIVFKHLASFELYIKPLVVFALVTLGVNEMIPLPSVAPMALAIVVLACALFGYLGNLERYGDFSYGIYILHFPIVQLLLLHPWFAAHAGVFVAVVVSGALGGAFLLWHLVEKPYLAASRNSGSRA